jgi:hypothetical protein
MQAREDGVEIGPNMIEFFVIIPIADLVRIVIDNKIGRTAGDCSGRCDSKDAATISCLEIVRPRVPLFDAGSERLAIPN